MEPGAATDGNRSQTASTRKRLKQGKTVAAGCDRLPQAAHGKEAVDGSSPSEGSLQKPRITGLFVSDQVQMVELEEPFLEPPGQKTRARLRGAGPQIRFASGTRAVSEQQVFERRSDDEDC